jgi:tetratricopeptide (TPR) repeat protein
MVVPAAERSRAAQAPPSSNGAIQAGNELTTRSGYATVRVDARFDASVYAEVFGMLQVPPRSKLLDLTPAQVVRADVFARLADAWTGRPGTVPRLAILLPFDRWVAYRDLALVHLRQLGPKGVIVEIFYAEQAERGGLDAWFASGRVVHNVAAVVQRLIVHWQPSAMWPVVIDTLAALVRAHTEAADAPVLLTQVAGLALSCGGAVEAAALAREVLRDLPETASKMRARTLRKLGCALLCLGDTAGGLSTLDAAVDVAVAARDPGGEATALCLSGLHAFNHADYAHAERRFRRAIQLLSPSSPRHLLAQAYRKLAIALMRQGGDGTEQDEVPGDAAERIAQDAVRDQDREPAPFVGAEDAMTDWPEIAAAFREIDAVLGIHIDLEAIRKRRVSARPRSPETTPPGKP